MKLRYDFTDQLDLTKFKKQASYYIGLIDSINLDLYVNDFRIFVFIQQDKSDNSSVTKIHFEELKRDDDGDIIYSNVINTLIDSRFNQIKFFQDIFNLHTCGFFKSNSVNYIVEQISQLIKILNKINNLKVFL